MGHGMAVTPGERTGSEALLGLEASMSSYPPTMGVMARYRRPNTERANASALRTIGESGNKITGDKLANAANRIGDVFEDFTKNRTLTIDNDAQNFVTRRLAASESGEDIVPLSGELKTILNNMTKQFGKPISGETWQRTASRLRALQRSTTDGNLKSDIGEVIDQWDQLAIRHADNPLDMERLANARKQYRSLMFLEQPGVITPDENISIRAANTRLNKDKRYKRMRTERPLSPNEVGQFAPVIKDAQILREIVANSGTATRSFIPGYLGYVSGAETLTGMAGRAAVAPTANLLTRAYLRSPQTLYGLIGRTPRAGLLGANSGYQSGR